MSPHEEEDPRLAYILLLSRILSMTFVGILLFLTAYLLRSEIDDYASLTVEERAILKASERNDSIHQEYLKLWKAPVLPKSQSEHPNYSLIKYGQQLIAHTAKYLGPKGSVAQISNGMNCQNCHLDAGTRPWGNNYAAVYSTYPKYRARSGTKEDIYKRINDCIERSLNGQPLDESSREMQSIKAYIEFIGNEVPKDTIPKGSGIFKVTYLKRAADPEKGEIVYQTKCMTCHQADGQGLLNPDEIEYKYPPLWGKNAYNHGAGLYRLSRLAGYVKYNMPLGATYYAPQLTDEEAWDVAAYINTQPRPAKDLSKDWPKVNEKPTDHPFGPYVDPFSEIQHKFGPFKEIDSFKKNQKK
jgi:thiosulfate dehydrogenase